MKYDNIYDILTLLTKYNIKVILDDNFKYLLENIDPQFKHNNKFNVKNFSLSQTAYNISLFGTIEGTINIDGKDIDTFVYRSIPIVKDGVTLDRNINFEIDQASKDYFINFLQNSNDISPVMENILLNIINNKPVNFKFIKPFDIDRYKNSNVDELVNIIKEKIKLSSEVKILKSFNKSDVKLPLDDELAQYFNKDGSLKEASVYRKNSDNNFKLTKIKTPKMNIPSVNQLIKKLDSGKKLTKGEQFLKQYFDKYKDYENDVDNTYYEKNVDYQYIVDKLTLTNISNKINGIQINIQKSDKIDNFDIDISIEDSEVLDNKSRLLYKYGIKEEDIPQFVKYIKEHRILNDKDTFELLKIVKNLDINIIKRDIDI